MQSRFRAKSRTLRKLYDEGFFGDIYYARAMAMRRRGVPASPSFLSKAIAGGGPLIDIGVHILDVLLWMIGCPKPVEAFGMTAKKFGHRADVINPWGKWDPAQFEVEDFAMGTIRFEGGLTVTLETAWASHIANIGGTFFMGDLAGATYEPLQIYLDKQDEMVNYTPELLKGLHHQNERECRKRQRRFRVTKRAVIAPTTYTERLANNKKSFHTAIREGLSSPVPAEEVLNVAKIFDALYESARIGRSVPIV